MSNDVLLDLVFDEISVWEKIIDKGVNIKHINPMLINDMCQIGTRCDLKIRIQNHKYKITPAHEAQIPKDNGQMRTIYVNEAQDRILLSAINNVIAKHCMSEFVNKNCVSYKEKIGCGKIDKHVQKELIRLKKEHPKTFKAYKLDLSKYFDNVPRKYIDEVLDKLELKFGKSSVIDLLREYYHNDTIIDLNKNEITKYTSLRQGCAFAAFLADCVLKDMDDDLSKMPIFYCRYSDDILIMGDETHVDNGLQRIKQHLSNKQLELNDKKVELLFQKNKKWFIFLGFTINENDITLSKNRVKNLKKEIDEICRTSKTKENALRRIYRYLYDKGSTFSYVETVFPIVTNKRDLHELDMYILDKVKSNPGEKIGGLGIDLVRKNHVVTRSIGRDVKKIKQRKLSINYTTMSYMWFLFNTDRNAYNIICNELMNT